MAAAAALLACALRLLLGDREDRMDRKEGRILNHGKTGPVLEKTCTSFLRQLWPFSCSSVREGGMLALWKKKRTLLSMYLNSLEMRSSSFGEEHYLPSSPTKYTQKNAKHAFYHLPRQKNSVMCAFQAVRRHAAFPKFPGRRMTVSRRLRTPGNNSSHITNKTIKTKTSQAFLPWHELPDLPLHTMRYTLPYLQMFSWHGLWEEEEGGTDGEGGTAGRQAGGTGGGRAGFRGQGAGGGRQAGQAGGSEKQACMASQTLQPAPCMSCLIISHIYL